MRHKNTLAGRIFRFRISKIQNSIIFPFSKKKEKRVVPSVSREGDFSEIVLVRIYERQTISEKTRKGK